MKFVNKKNLGGKNLKKRKELMLTGVRMEVTVEWGGFRTGQVWLLLLLAGTFLGAHFKCFINY